MVVHELREPVTTVKTGDAHRIIVDIPMRLSRIEGALALIAVICVLSIFFFPAMRGPYSVVHGPVTALLAARAAAGLRMSIAGVRVVRERLAGAHFARAQSVWTPIPFLEFPNNSLSAECISVLRC
jgi:hypothetical protein